ncbi:hypothetical protein LINGRAHAP2_LOCUS30465 [Linum grandiflorum]
MYFLWFTNSPSVLLANSKPRKYFNGPKSLTSNSRARFCLMSLMPAGSLPVTIISSTYTMSTTSLSLE